MEVMVRPCKCYHQSKTRVLAMHSSRGTIVGASGNLTPPPTLSIHQVNVVPGVVLPRGPGCDLGTQR